MSVLNNKTKKKKQKTAVNIDMDYKLSLLNHASSLYSLYSSRHQGDAENDTIIIVQYGSLLSPPLMIIMLMMMIGRLACTGWG